jgi:hypothetical protein
MNVFIATKSGIKVLGRVLTISSMDLIIISGKENYKCIVKIAVPLQ